MGKSSINGQFSMAMLNNHRVISSIHHGDLQWKKGKFHHDPHCSPSTGKSWLREIIPIAGPTIQVSEI